MTLPYYAWIAWRYLRARVRQTALTISGVALGVTIVTVMQSYMGGFLDFFVQRALQSTPSVTVTQTQAGLPSPAGPVRRALRAISNPVVEVRQLPVPAEEEELENPRQAEVTIARLPDVVTVAPFIAGQGLVVNGDIRQPVSYLGVRPREEARVTDFGAQLTAGSVDDLAERGNGIILGVLLASDLSADIGDRVTIISQEGVSLRFEVVGLYSAELEEVDQVRAYVNLRQGQRLSDTRGVSGLGVRTTSLYTAAPVARMIEAQTPYTARSWREVNANILDLFTTISAIIYMVVGFTMVVAGFGIANTLILTVSEKRRDVGVLKALGVPPRQVALIFVCIGLLVGIAGVLIGEVLGAFGIAWMDNLPIPGQPGREGPPLTVETFPMLRTPRVYILSALFGLLVSVASSVVPSLRAAKSDPLEVIRGAE